MIEIWCLPEFEKDLWSRYDVYQNLKKSARLFQYDNTALCKCSSAQVLPFEAIFVATVTFKKTTVEPLYNSSLGEKGAIVKR